MQDTPNSPEEIQFIEKLNKWLSIEVTKEDSSPDDKFPTVLSRLSYMWAKNGNSFAFRYGVQDIVGGIKFGLTGDEALELFGYYNFIVGLAFAFLQGSEVGLGDVINTVLMPKLEAASVEHGYNKL
jgi:hypothetical protein